MLPPRFRGPLAVLAASVALASCATYTPRTAGYVTASPGDGIAVVFARGASPETSGKTAAEAVECVVTALRRARPDLRIVPEGTFLPAAFPDLPREAAPLGEESLKVVAADAGFRQRTESVGVRFLLVVSGSTIRQLGKPEMVSGGIPPYQAATVYVPWERHSRFLVSVLDVPSGEKLGEASSAGEGKGFFFMAVPIAIAGWPALSESEVCRRLGIAVAEMFVRPAAPLKEDRGDRDRRSGRLPRAPQGSAPCEAARGVAHASSRTDGEM